MNAKSAMCGVKTMRTNHRAQMTLFTTITRMFRYFQNSSARCRTDLTSQLIDVPWGIMYFIFIIKAKNRKPHKFFHHSVVNVVIKVTYNIKNLTLEYNLHNFFYRSYWSSKIKYPIIQCKAQPEVPVKFWVSFWIILSARQ